MARLVIYEPCILGLRLGLGLRVKCPNVSAVSSRLAAVQSTRSKPWTRPRASYFSYARLAMSMSEADLTSMLCTLGADDRSWGCLT